MRLEQDGAELEAGFYSDGDVADMLAILASDDLHLPGNRLGHIGVLDRWIGSGSPLCAHIAGKVGAPVQAVRAILFDKNGQANWALGWHQDRTVAVRERAEVEGFQNWTTKGGIQHVEPPFELLKRMITVRIHLDPVPANNAPLLVIPGSHLKGKIVDTELAELVSRSAVSTCTADAGDVWFYRTPIIHASDRATPGKRRRVLQVDYSPDDLPPPLQWYYS